MLFDFLKPKNKERKIYVVIETHYPEFIDNVKLCYSEKQAEENEAGDISEFEYAKQGADMPKIIYVFKEKSNDN